MATWRRWFAWYPVRISNNHRVWLCFVEYERVSIPIYTDIGGRGVSETITHYRMVA